MMMQWWKGPLSHITCWGSLSRGKSHSRGSSLNFPFYPRDSASADDPELCCVCSEAAPKPTDRPTETWRSWWSSPRQQRSSLPKDEILIAFASVFPSQAATAAQRCQFSFKGTDSITKVALQSNLQRRKLERTLGVCFFCFGPSTWQPLFPPLCLDMTGIKAHSWRS